MQKLLTFFQQKKKNSAYAILNDQSFNDTLSNDIVSFEQLGPGYSKECMSNLELLSNVTDFFVKDVPCCSTLILTFNC